MERKQEQRDISTAVVFIIPGCFSLWLEYTVYGLVPQHCLPGWTKTIALSNKVTGLESGYKVAGPDMGKLRLWTRKGVEKDAMFKPSVSFDGQQSDSEETKNKGRTGQWVWYERHYANMRGIRHTPDNLWQNMALNHWCIISFYFALLCFALLYFTSLMIS